MALSPSGRHERARLGALTRHHPDQPELAETARRALREEKTQQYIDRLVDIADELTPAQRARLIRQLNGAVGG
jgi:hypothetical protein